MVFPISFDSFVNLELNAKNELTNSELKSLTNNIELVRDAVIATTAFARAKGIGGHTGGPYDIVPEVLIIDALRDGGEDIHDEFINKLEKRMQTLRVGNPLDKNTDIGAINSKEQLNKIEGLVNEGVSDGGKIFQTECELPGNGFWFKPTLFTDVQPSYSIAREEIFGPVLTTLTFRTPQEAVEIANNTEYGLSAGVWTEKGSKIIKEFSFSTR
mgnify:CR=1 FL=1